MSSAPGSLGKSKSKEMYHLKQQAMKYYAENKVPIQMENILNLMFYEKPPDVYGYLANFFSKSAKPARISKILALQVLDSSGLSTVQVDVYCTVNNLEKLICTSTSSRPDIRLPLEDPDKTEAVINASIMTAVNSINFEGSSAFAGMDPLVQREIDSEILTYWGFKDMRIEKQTHKLESYEDKDLLVPNNSAVDIKHRKSIVRARSGGKLSGSLPNIPDRPLETFSIGCEVATAVSQAVCVCAAKCINIPVYQHIANLTYEDGCPNQFRIPIPMVTIIQSGKSVSGKVMCVKEFMVVPGTKMPIDKSIGHIVNIFRHVSRTICAKQGPFAKFVNETGALCPQLETINQGLDFLLDAVNAQGLIIGEDIHLAIQCAGYESYDNEKGKYESLAGQFKSPEEMVDFWLDIIKKYPSIVAIIDPLRTEDIDQWMRLSEKISEGIFIIGDRFFERPGILKCMDYSIQTSGIVLHMERLNTISDIIECSTKYQDFNNELVISTNNGDTTDTFLVDLAVGINARFIKLGGPSRGEKTCKLNRLLQIYRELMPTVEVEQAEFVREDNSEFYNDQDGISEHVRVESPQDKNEQLKDQTLEEKGKVRRHDSFTFPLIRKISLADSDVKSESVLT